MPSYLTERDDVWVRGVIEDLDGLVGRTAAQVADEFQTRVMARARAAGAPARAVEGVWHVCLRTWTLRVTAPLKPERVREAVFEEAGRQRDRDRALDAAAARLEATREQLLVSLFADRPESRRLLAPPGIPSPREIVLRYNLSLLQGILLRAVDLDVFARSNVRSVVRFAKLRGLLCTYHAWGQGIRIALSGPLSVLRETTKYGRALAVFVPAAVATPGWSIDARCRVGGHLVRLRATGADPIASTHALPRDCDSSVERALARDVRRLATGWTIERETTAIRAGSRMFFPDFTLSRTGVAPIHVEIVGYYTPEYLSSKLQVLRDAGLRRIIVCVDESLTRDRGAVRASAVLFYRRRIDATKLVTLADAIAADDAGPVDRRAEKTSTP